MYWVAYFNRIVSKVDHFLNNEAKRVIILGVHSIEALTQLLKRSRQGMLLVQGGKAIDDFIHTLIRIDFFCPKLFFFLLTLLF